MELMRTVMGEGGEVAFLSGHGDGTGPWPRWPQSETYPESPGPSGLRPRSQRLRGGWLRPREPTGGRRSSEGETRPRRLGGWRARRPAPSEPARSPPGTWGAAGRWRAASGARPLLGRDTEGPAPDSEPLGPESDPPCRPRRLIALRAPQPQTHPGPTRGAQLGSAWRTWDAYECKPRAAAGGHRCTLRPVSLRGDLGHRKEHGPAGQRARGSEERTP